MEIINGEKVASNPTTGAKVVLRGGSWVPYTPAAPSPAAAAAPSAPPTPTSAGGGALSSIVSGAEKGLEYAKAGGEKASQFYREKIYPEQRKAIGSVVEKVGEDIRHPLQQFAHPEQEMLQRMNTPYEHMTPFAKEVADFLTPETLTGEVMMAAPFALPEAGLAERIVGAGPISKALGTRTGRAAAGVGLGAATGYLTGEGTLQGAKQGALGIAAPEAGAGVWERYGPREAIAAKDLTKKVGRAIENHLPWVGRIRNGEDFANLMRGGKNSRIVQMTGDMLRGVKNKIAPKASGYFFHVPVPTSKGIGRMVLGFEEADKLATDLQQGLAPYEYEVLNTAGVPAGVRVPGAPKPAIIPGSPAGVQASVKAAGGYAPSGAERAGAIAREQRILARKIREELADGLNKIEKGLGDEYRKAGRKFAAASGLAGIFHPIEEVIKGRTLNQPELIARMEKAAPELYRTLGRDTTEGLMQTLRRGFAGVDSDVAAKITQHPWYGRLLGMGIGGGIGSAFGHPLIGTVLGELAGEKMPISTRTPAKLIGEVPFLARPAHAAWDALESALVRHVGKPDPPTKSPAIKAADDKRHAALAGPHATADKIGDVASISNRIASASKPADVNRDLTSGRVSLGHVRKMLDADSGADLASTFQGLSPADTIDVLAKASPSERETFFPAVVQKLNDSRNQMSPQQSQMLMAQLRRMMSAPEATA